jgi:glucose/arabinose dehydrogenase
MQTTSLLVNFSTFALILLWMGLLAMGLALLAHKRWLGGLLVLEGALGAAVHLTLSLVAVGIGEPLIRIGKQDLLAWGLAGFAVALVVALMVLPRRLLHMGRGKLTGFALAAPVIAASSLAGLSHISTPPRERERDASRRAIQLAPGFKAEVFASAKLNNASLDNPTTMTFKPSGELFIADIAGNIWLAQDTNNDHVADAVTKWADGFSLLLGLVWRGDELYVSSAGKIEALKDANNDGVADARRTLAEGLPALILNPHSNNSLSFGPDGRLYFGVGATSDDGVEKNPRAAAILSVSPDGGDVRVFARGFGNPFEAAFNSKGDLFSGDNSGQTGPDGLPAPDEFNQVKEGEDYGFVKNDPLNQQGKTQAMLSFAPHSTPTGLAFYTGKAYPPEYFDNAFIALWNTGEVKRIQLTPDNRGGYIPDDSVFGSGFLYPIDVVVGPDDVLYIADFGTSVVYRVSYGE